MKNVLMVFALMCSMVTSVQAQGGGGYGGLKTAAEQKIQQAEQAIWSAIAAYNSTQALLDGIVVMPPLLSDPSSLESYEQHSCTLE